MDAEHNSFIETTFEKVRKSADGIIFSDFVLQQLWEIITVYEFIMLRLWKIRMVRQRHHSHPLRKRTKLAESQPKGAPKWFFLIQ